MARTSITVTSMTTASPTNPLSFDTGDSTNDMQFTNDGKTWLLIDNQSGSSATVTLIAAGTDEDVTFSDLSLTISNGDFVAIPPMAISKYNQSDGVVHVDMDQNVNIVAVTEAA